MDGQHLYISSENCSYWKNLLYKWFGSGYIFEVSNTKGFGLSLCQFRENSSFQIMSPIGQIFIKLPIFIQRLLGDDPSFEMMKSWGFTWRWGKYDRGRNLHLNWGNKCKILNMPWDYKFIRHSVMLESGIWRDVNKETEKEYGYYRDWTDKFQREYDYIYKLENGEIQYRRAIVIVEEREWRWKWNIGYKKFQITPIMIKRCIDVTFNDEVGEETGSWKGGCIGCGYDMVKHETPLNCLRRMEKERKF